MAERKREGMAPPALGGSSLLVAFAVLALTVFALLSLSTVQADVRLADASAQAVTDYYAADVTAQEVLARLRNGETVEDLKRLGLDLGSAELETVPSSLWVGSLPSDQEGQSAFIPPADPPYGQRVDYAVPISDTQELQVEVALYADGSYDILRWQAIPIGEWEPDDTLNVWTGEDE